MINILIYITIGYLIGLVHVLFIFLRFFGFRFTKTHMKCLIELLNEEGEK